MGPPKYPLILVIFLTLSPTFTHSYSKTDPHRTRGDSLLIGSYVEPSAINPILTHSSISAMLKRIIFDGLIKLNEKMEPIPHLASFWENSRGGLTWTFHLRKDVTFHDGAELTAEDVKFTFDKIQDPSLNSPYINIFKNLKSVTAKDRYTVVIDLKTPLPSLPFYLDVGILPKHLLMGKELITGEFNYHPIGTGPYKMGSWSNDEIILTSNEHYFEGRPYLNNVVTKIFKDQRTVWAALVKGNVDCVFLTYPKNYDLLEKLSDFNVYSFLNPYYYIAAFNKQCSIFRQKKVRQALNYAIDKEIIVRKVLRGKGQISSGTVYPQSWAYDKSIEPYPYIPKKALRLLKEAGWKDTNGNDILDKNGEEFRFTLLTLIGDKIAEESSLLIQQQLLDLGVRITIKAIPLSLYFEKFFMKKFDVGILNIISDDPDKNYVWWHSSQINGGFNVFSYQNEKVDEFLEKGRTIFDRQERKGIYRQFQKEIHDDPPGVFLFWRDDLIGVHKRFRGVRVSPAGIFNHINEWYVPKEEQKYR